MTRRAHLLSLAVALAAVTLVAPPHAHADPDYSRMFDNFTLGFRGFTGVAPGFGTSFVNGGDVRLAIEWPSFGIIVGGRFAAVGDDQYLGPRGARAPAAQFAVMDVGCRAFLRPQLSTGFYLGGGASFGSTFIDGFAFRNASLYGAFVEGGVDLPRTSPARITAAVRLDLDASTRARFSRVPDAGAVVMITANVGFLFGGSETGSSDD